MHTTIEDHSSNFNIEINTSNCTTHAHTKHEECMHIHVCACAHTHTDTDTQTKTHTDTNPDRQTDRCMHARMRVHNIGEITTEFIQENIFSFPQL